MQEISEKTSDLVAYIEKMHNLRLVVVGDIMLDRFFYGCTNRISPESSAPIFDVEKKEMMLGGAGNVLSNLAGLGASANIISVIGDDESGRTILKLVRDMGEKESGVIVTTSRPTTVKTRYVAQSKQIVRVDEEVTDPLTSKLEEEVFGKISAVIKDADGIILSDYKKGVLTAGLLSRIIGLAKKNSVPVIADPKGYDYSIYKGADVLTPNRKELFEATGGMATKTDEEVISAGELLIEKFDLGAVLATRSEEGVSAISRSDEAFHVKANVMEVFDVSGAGDTVVATVAAALASGATLQEAAFLANKAGEQVVAKTGTVAVGGKELIAALSGQVIAASEESKSASVRNNDAAYKDEKQNPSFALFDWELAKGQIDLWRSQGLKIGFTNGCFDILHVGHVGYLQRAREKCDRLIIGINCDASVKRLKGSERPVNDEISRATVLYSMGCVDMVILFGSNEEEEDKPSVLIDFIRPDMFFKGGDYEEADLPEAAVVRAYGGEIIIMDLYDGHSTTNIISRMKGAVA
jgi:D-beta-D-heptose 7-phosphate kinase/D-beta-D-heptose 1-phosphate adenosyltransferase